MQQVFKLVPAVVAGKNADGSFCPTNDANACVLVSPDSFEVVPDAVIKAADGKWPINSSSGAVGHVIVGQQVWKTKSP
jgi:hypothetical protein